MREQFAELLRTDFVHNEPEDFPQFMRDSAEAAQKLELALRTWIAQSADTEPPATVPRMSAEISNYCEACHKQFRDVPLSEQTGPGGEVLIAASNRSPSHKYGVIHVFRQANRRSVTADAS